RNLCNLERSYAVVSLTPSSPKKALRRNNRRQFRSFSNVEPAVPSLRIASAMKPSVIYIAQGKINLQEPGRPVRLIESKVGQSVIDRASRIQQRNAWKTQGTGAKFMAGRVLWGGGEEDPTAIPMAVTGISCGTRNEELIYSIATHEITGVFALRNQATDEQ